MSETFEQIVSETGLVKWFNDTRGYGFLQTNDGRDVFVHYSEIEQEGRKCLEPGQSVQFEICTGPKGLQAKKVLVFEHKEAKPSES